MQKAVLAAEDRDFYDEPRLLPDRHRPRGVGDACAAGTTQGGVDDHPAVREELLPHADRSLTRKFKEIIISVKIDQQQ